MPSRLRPSAAPSHRPVRSTRPRGAATIRGARRGACSPPDLGLVAYETVAREGLVAAEDVLIEIVRPGTGEPVSPGEVGEVVVTSFDHDRPWIRLALGDLSAVLPGPSPCGRTNIRIRGWL